MAKLPYVFIGSSVEGLDAAKAIQANLQHSCECLIWFQGLFGLAGGTLETLVAKLHSFDFAVLCLTPDDLTRSKGSEQPSPRDNVVLELGLFIGALGRERVYMVVDREATTKLPTDLAGITPAKFAKPHSGTWQSALGPASTEIEKAIEQLGCRKAPQYSLGFQIEWQVNTDSIGIAMIVANCDAKVLPPHVACLSRPNAIFRPFRTIKRGELLSSQMRRYELAIHEGKDYCDLTMIVKQLLSSQPDGTALGESQIDEFRLELVLEDSNTVLYESNVLGPAIVRLIRHLAHYDSGPTIPPDLAKIFEAHRKSPETWASR